MRRLVLFDLDDTLFDHQYARRAALEVLRQTYTAARAIEFEALERIQERHLQATHALLLDRRLTVPQARRERMRLLFADVGATLSTGELDEADTVFRSAYENARRAVPGAIRLLTLLHGRCRRVVLTNGLVHTQREKLRVCGLESLLDDFIISEEVGHKKPGREIFELGLRSGQCSAEQAVMIGDSWNFDIAGALNAGIHAVWLNRYSDINPSPERVPELTSLEPAEQVLRVLLG